MKKAIQAILQRLLGFDNYLFIFSLFKIRTLKWDGKDKEGDFNFFLRLLRVDETVLDIGANVGIMTVLMARACKRGKIFAFEPVPENFRALQRMVNWMKLKNVEVYQIALGDTDCEVGMQMPVLHGVKMQGLSHVAHASIDGYKARHITYRVKQQRLDSLPFIKTEKISAIKMDVENYEQFVLRGGMRMIKASMPLIYCELWDNENRRICLELLKDAGYAAKVLQEGNLVDYIPEFHTHHNFFFFPPDRKPGNNLNTNSQA